jgi:hypothetical protein
MAFAWNRQSDESDENDETPFTYYSLSLAKSALGALRRLHDEVGRRPLEIADAWAQPIGDYLDSDSDDDTRALLEAYWDCALTLWDSINRQVSALNVGDAQTVEEAVRDIGFALKVIDRMGIANW